jgi:hypothetical protein
MTETTKITDKTATQPDPQVEELSVKELEDRLAFANAARCDIASDTAATTAAK